MTDHEATPETLREVADAVCRALGVRTCGMAGSIRTHADAWEAENLEWEDAISEWKEMEPALRARLLEVERAAKETLKDKDSMDDAPVWMGTDEARGYISGWNAALAALRLLVGGVT